MRLRMLAVLTVLVVVASACGNSKSGTSATTVANGLTPQTTASAADPKMARTPSPRVLTSSPRVRWMALRRAAKWVRRTSLKADWPSRVMSSVEPTRSVNRTVAVPVRCFTAE